MIPRALYKKIVELVPILCVDIILIYKDKYIIAKRNNEPLKNRWWIIGGRVLRGEQTIKAAKRKVKEETGLSVSNLEIFGVYEDIYKKSALGIPMTCVSIVYRGNIKKYNPTLDNTNLAIKLSNKLPHRFLTKIVKL